MKRNELKSRNGITLIALIITIIILLILAMVTINILINQGIIGHANNAVRGYEVAEEKEQISLAYQNYKMDQLNNKDATFDMTQEDATVVPDEEVHGWYITFNKTKHNYTLTEDGTVETSGARWVKNGDDITLGDVTVKVGDYIGYDHTKDANGNAVAIPSYTSYALANADSSKNNGRTNGYTSDYTFNVNNYTGGWRVLGVKNGKLQLISASSVGGLYLSGQEGYRDAEDELNAICAIYGQGKGAVAGSARSINIDDVNAITGYNPVKTGNGEPYAKGEINEYGNEITYYWKGNDIPYYTGTNGKEGNTGDSHINGFVWHDESGLHNSPKSTTATNTETGRERITILKNTDYKYYSTTLTDSTSGDIRGTAADSNEYKVLFGQNYWLASRCRGGNFYRAYFAVRNVSNNLMTQSWLFFSSGDTNDRTSLIRAVVALSSDVQIKSDATHDGTSAAKAYILQ